MSFLLFVGDLHVGGTTALAPKGRIVTKEQEWLAARWVEFTKEIDKRAKKYGGYHLMLGGDLIEGRHHNSAQVWGNFKEQRDGAVELLLPLASKARSIFAIAGTEAHAGDDGEHDRTVAQELGARHIQQRFTLEHDGGRIWWAHHGVGVGRLPWTRTSGMVSLARQAAHRPHPPRYVIAHHAHQSPRPVTVEGVTVAICPCWQLPTPYGYRVAPHSNVTIGALILHAGEIEQITYEREEKAIAIV